MNVFLTVSALAMAALDPEHSHEHAPQLGKLTFETTCSPAAQASFETGLRWLHSFGYQPAERNFDAATASDPNCAIAYWGLAMSQYHPLWYPPTAEELHKGAAALAKAREVVGHSQREKDYVAALGAFYDRADKLSHPQRVLAYEAAMEQLHRRYSTDREAAAFYALSLIAAGTLDDDPDYSREKKAGAILNTIFKQEPDHPGVAHYLIHGFDYPALAELALPAARRYAAIAPDSSHAHHMPSHIFTRLGLWDESIASNRSAEAAARAYSAANRMPASSDQRLHAMDYLSYAYLQAGRDGEAERILEDLSAINAIEPASQTAAYAVTAIPARVLLERRLWKEAAAFDLPPNLNALTAVTKYKWAEANVRFANAIGAARIGDVRLARDQIAKLAAIETAVVVQPGEYDWRKQVAIERQIAEAWAAYSEGKKDEALRIMRAAAELDDATEKHPVTPGSILPAREQLGELLLELGRSGEALTEYEASLERAPRRLAGVYGAAQAAKLAGETKKANSYYAELVGMTAKSDGGRAEIKSARLFEASLGKVQR